MSPFALYLLGALLIVGALAFASVLLNVPPIAVGAVVVLALVGIGAWATRRPRLKPSKFTGETHETPSLDPTMLTELKTELMQKPELKTELMQKPQVSRTAKTSVVEPSPRPDDRGTER